MRGGSVAEIKYINLVSRSDGWMNIKTPMVGKVSVPAGLRVAVTGQKDRRAYFTFMEGSAPANGVFAGLRGDVWIRDPDTNEPTLVDNPRDMHHEEALIFINLDPTRPIVDKGYPMLEGELWMGARSGPKAQGPISMRLDMRDLPPGMIAPDDRDTADKVGWSGLGLPDYPHSKSDRYSARFRRIWFPIYPRSKLDALDNEERYLHCGLYSEGCLSVDPARWDSVYDYLIRRRKGPTRVGAIHMCYKR